MKKATPTPKTTEPKITSTRSNHLAHVVIGAHFTKHLIDTNDSCRQFGGFNKSAEECLKESTTWYKRIFWAIGSVIITLIALKIVSALSLGSIATVYTLIILGGLTFIQIHGLSIGNYHPGDAAMMVASEWRMWRSVALKIGLVQELSDSIRFGYERYENELMGFNYLGQNLEESLSSHLQGLLVKFAAEVKTAERDGHKTVKRKNRDLFYKTDKLGVALGYNSVDWSRYFTK